jgi:hypothetical protein
VSYQASSPPASHRAPTVHPETPARRESPWPPQTLGAVGVGASRGGLVFQIDAYRRPRHRAMFRTWPTARPKTSGVAPSRPTMVEAIGESQERGRDLGLGLLGKKERNGADWAEPSQPGLV